MELPKQLIPLLRSWFVSSASISITSIDLVKQIKYYLGNRSTAMEICVISPENYPFNEVKVIYIEKNKTKIFSLKGFIRKEKIHLRS